MKIVAYELRDRGIDHSQYYHGDSISFTSWDYVFTGASDTPFNAGEDAIEQCAMTLDLENIDSIKNTLYKRVDSRLLHSEDCPYSTYNKRHDNYCTCESELYCYAALYIKTDAPDGLGDLLDPTAKF